MSARTLFHRGEWAAAESGRTFAVHDPATGDTVGEASDGGAVDTARAVTAAHDAFPAWAALPARERSAVLMRWNALLLSRQEEVARTLVAENGKPIKEARAEVAYGAGFVEWSAEEAKRIYGETIPFSVPGKRHIVLRQPVGVTGAITPWNFPLAMVTRKVAPALAAGCTVVLKPAEQTPLTAAIAIKLLAEAGAPPGVANLVTGSDPAPIGHTLLTDPLVRKITFTGSTEVGKLLMRGAADQVKKLSLELGGCAPFLVFADADLEKAAEGLLWCKFRNAGQTCICANRIYVEEAIYDEFLKRFTEKVRAIRVGCGLAEETQLGPLIDAAALAKVEEHVDDARRHGARVFCGGRRLTEGSLARGNFYEPTVLASASGAMRCMREETFGPVAPIAPFRTEDEAVRLANDTRYGLAAYFYTRDVSRVVRLMERLEYGIIGANDPSPAVPQAPFGGFKESGIGREGGKFALEEFLEVKHVCLGV